MMRFRKKLFLVVVLITAAGMFATGCANNEKMSLNYNLKTLQQEAQDSGGNAYFRQSVGFFADIGGKEVGIINAPADQCWEEVVKIVHDQNRLDRIYSNVSWFKGVEILDTNQSSVVVRFKAGFIITASVDMMFDINDMARKVDGRKIGGSFGTFAIERGNHDIVIMPIDENKTLMIVWVDGAAMFPANFGAAMGSAIIGVNSSVIPRMSSAWIQEVREGLGIIQ